MPCSHAVMVAVRYGEPYRSSFGKLEERIKAGTIGELLDKVEAKYQGKEYAGVVSKYSMVFWNNQKLLNVNDRDYGLKPKDTVTLMQIIGGG